MLCNNFWNSHIYVSHVIWAKWEKNGCPIVIEWAVKWKYEFIDDMTSVYSNQCFMLGAALEQPFNCVIKLATSIAALTYKYPTHIHIIYDTHISWTHTFLMRYALYEFNGHSTRQYLDAYHQKQWLAERLIRNRIYYFECQLNSQHSNWVRSLALVATFI